MGEELLNFYRHKLKREYKIAFISTFIISLLIHIYKFTNTLPNHDSVYNYYDDQNILGLGRWALSLACGISSYYDLPWVIGLLSCVFIALTVVVIIAVLNIKNPVLIILTGALIAASPSITETFFFEFTADGYMIAMLLAALSVYFSRIDEKRISRWILSGICICVSCGIYQAYVSFALILAICYFINELLQNSFDKKLCLKWILRQIITYAVALAAYYAIWKLLLHITGTSAKNYQGISRLGSVSLGLLINGLKKSFKTTIMYFLQWNVLQYGFSLYSVLNIIFVPVFALGIIFSCIKSGILHRKWALGLLILCLIAIAPFAGIWHFTSEHVIYRPMMLQSLALLFVLCAQLYEKWARPKAKNLVCLFLIVIAFNEGILANISYFYMNLCYERTYADGLEMMIAIHDMQDKYDFDRIAVVGNRVYDVRWENIDSETGKMNPSGNIHFFNEVLEQNFLYDADHTVFFLKTTFGLDIKRVKSKELKRITKLKEVQAMDCWPSGDSMTVIDNTLVLKLSDYNEY